MDVERELSARASISGMSSSYDKTGGNLTATAPQSLLPPIAAVNRRFSLLPSMPHGGPRWKTHARHGWKTVHDTTFFADQPVTGNLGVCGLILTLFSYLVIFVTLPISALFCIKIVLEYERAVIFRLGRLVHGGARGPGLFVINPCTDSYRKVDLRVLSFDVPPQEILSKDSVTVAVDVVVYFRISNATISVTNVEDSSRSTKLLAQTTLRNILGTKTLTEMLSDREQIALQIQETLDEATYPWGVKVERVEVKDVRLPVQLQRAMAAEAEASREARAKVLRGILSRTFGFRLKHLQISCKVIGIHIQLKVIAAEGEQLASRALSEAATVLSQSPSAIHLSLLQTLNTISAEKNQTIVIPIPAELIRAFMRSQKKPKAVDAQLI
jgi:erythrocyte band 7 integral membrane protein